MVSACAFLASARAEPALLPAVEIRAGTESLSGEAAASSEGLIPGQRLAAQSLLRPGEALEMVPGLIVTQHAGDGKANQYFLRGFNLDHGTDFATSVAGVPVNMPSHAHGQGYTDLNFLIPELVDAIRYRKGPYYAEEGDFASAGAAHIDYLRRLDRALAQVTVGEGGYARGLLAGSPAAGNGNWLYAFEWFHNDGPWENPENYRKLNGVLRYSEGSRNLGWAVTAMAYRGDWLSTDQVPQRAIDLGLVSRYGTLDPSSGGEAQRYSLAGEWAGRDYDSQSQARAWWLASSLQLWSNFQYCLNNGCPPGDQFKQSEHRQAGGFALNRTVFSQWQEMEVEKRIGLEGRVDRLSPVGLYRSQARTTLGILREDDIVQRSLGLWVEGEMHWTRWLRSIAGLRGDAYDFSVDSSLDANSGRARARLLTPKFALIAGPWRKTELYFNYGHGFHSNDARGVTTTVDPADGATRVEPVQPLVRSRGSELGVRSELAAGWQTTVALWQLDLASELVFAGDAGTTEATRPSHRYGLEWSNTCQPISWLALDADLAWSQARYRDPDPAGDHIPGAVTSTANVGIALDAQGPWSAALRLRYFGPRPLEEGKVVRSSASTLANLRLAYRLDRSTRLALDVFNVFDRRTNDIEYWYESRLPGETGSRFDRHIHPGEPRTLHLSLVQHF